jgi:hypothetical protein
MSILLIVLFSAEQQVLVVFNTQAHADLYPLLFRDCEDDFFDIHLVLCWYMFSIFHEPPLVICQFIMVKYIQYIVYFCDCSYTEQSQPLLLAHTNTLLFFGTLFLVSLLNAEGVIVLRKANTNRIE